MVFCYKNFLHGEAPPRCHPFIYHFWQKRYGDSFSSFNRKCNLVAYRSIEELFLKLTYPGKWMDYLVGLFKIFWMVLLNMLMTVFPSFLYNPTHKIPATAWKRHSFWAEPPCTATPLGANRVMYNFLGLLKRNCYKKQKELNQEQKRWAQWDGKYNKTLLD